MTGPVSRTAAVLAGLTHLPRSRRPLLVFVGSDCVEYRNPGMEGLGRRVARSLRGI